VYGLFEARIRKINEDKMMELEEKLIQEFNALQKANEVNLISAGKFETLDVLDGGAAEEEPPVKIGAPVVQDAFVEELGAGIFDNDSTERIVDTGEEL
jgi:hypothetical protein